LSGIGDGGGDAAPPLREGGGRGIDKTPHTKLAPGGLKWTRLICIEVSQVRQKHQEIRGEFRAVSEQFQSNFGVNFEQFESNLRAISEQIPGQFQGNFRAV